MTKEVYPFVVRGPTDKLVKISADTYNNALSKALATNPSRFISTGYAQRTAGIRRVKKAIDAAPAFIEQIKSVEKLKNKIYLNVISTMDLQTARKQAAADSKAQKKKIYVNLDDEMECILSSIPSADPENVMAAFVNGTEVELELPKQSQAKTTKTNAALSKASKKSLTTKSGKRLSEEIMEQAEKIESKQKTKQRGDGTQTNMAKKAKKTAAKAAPKKSAKVAVKKTTEVTGTKKSLSVKEMRDLIKKGSVIRNAKGFYYSELFLAAKKDQSKKHDVFVK